MHILEAALFTNLGTKQLPPERDLDGPRTPRSFRLARPFAAIFMLASLVIALDVSSPAAPAEPVAQAETATMTISGLVSVRGDLSKLP